MAIFKKSDPASSAARERAAAPRGAAGENAISIIGPGMQVVGDLITEGTVRIEGSIRGTIEAGKAVVLGRGGEVVGDIVTQDAVVGGRVHGTITAHSRLELQSGCTVDGEIHTRAEHLQLDEGARFNGHIHMLEEGEPAAPPEVPEPAEPARLPAADGEDIPSDTTVYPQPDKTP